MQSTDKVTIVGAGVGGLSAAVVLAARGCRVTVLERGHAPGGKMREVAVGNARIDAGPTVFTMRWVFEELFDIAGASLEDELQLSRAELLARHAWDDRGALDLFADQERSAAAIDAFSGAGEGKRFLAFMAEARAIYATLRESFISNSRTNLLGLTGRVSREGRLGGWLKLNPYTSLWQALGKHFRDPRLQQLFGRYATYAGSSPFLAPATLMLIAHVEQEGVWLVEGGMHRLAVALARLAERQGAEIRYGAEVDEILTAGNRTTGVRLRDGTAIDADAVVLNADISALGRGLFGSGVSNAVKPTPVAQRSLSALTWNMVAHTSGFPLLRHTVFFSADYEAEFTKLLKRGELPDRPTVYVCAQDRGAQPGAGTETLDHDRLLLLVNAPPLGDRAEFGHAEIERCFASTLGLLERCGLHLEPEALDTRVTTGPNQFEQLFPATGGALYGRASHGWQASFSRPGARSKLPGLYLAGGSTHPGAGVPMAALSGRQAASAVLDDIDRRRTGRG
jgi:1-hydroxycarotenoid 3,4-desaturase